MSVLIIIPTVTGREKYLENAVADYNITLSNGNWPLESICGHEFYIVKDKKTCGEVWNEGAKYARDNGFDYVHMTADDLSPWMGWYECAVETAEMLERGYLPAARVMLPDGTCQVHGVWGQQQVDWKSVDGGSVPFCRTEDWIDIPNIHYWSDNAYDSAQKIVNKKTFVARTNYAFTHYTAQAGRKPSAGEEEMKIWKEWEETL